MNTAAPRLMLFGYGSALEAALASVLCAEFSVCGIVVSTHRRDLSLRSMRVKSGGLNIPLHTDLGLAQVQSLLEREKPRLCLMASYNNILPPAVLEKFDVVNIHYAPLPYYRGWHPVNWGLARGESEFAYSIHQAVAQVDAGPILQQGFYRAGENDTAEEVIVALSNGLETNCGVVLRRYLRGEITPQPQRGAGSKFPKRTPADGRVDFKKSAREIHNLVRAVAPPYPGARAECDAGEALLLRTLLSHEHTEPTVAPGALRHCAGRWFVAAADAWLELREWQCPIPLADGMRWH